MCCRPEEESMIRLSDHFSYSRLLRYTLPSIIMLVFTSIYGVVDGFFVSNFVGKTPFAAVNFIMPFLLILGCVGFLFGTGGGALIAKTMGEGKPEEANRLFSMLVWVSLACGIILSATGFLLLRPIAAALGAQGELLEQSILYGQIILAAIPAYVLQFEFQCLFATAEKPKLGLYVTVAAGMTNVVLDALFVAVFSWGLRGAGSRHCPESMRRRNPAPRLLSAPQHQPAASDLGQTGSPCAAAGLSQRFLRTDEQHLRINCKHALQRPAAPLCRRKRRGRPTAF